MNLAAQLTSAPGLALLPDFLDPMTLLTKFGDAALWGAALIVLVECGLFIFLLPGDSLLFTIGLLTAGGVINQPLWLVCTVLFIAAIAGNIIGYEIGAAVGPKLFSNPNSKLLKPEHIDKTQEFFDKYGPRAIFLARFVPIVRTFITLTAGVGRMNRAVFYSYSAIGALFWAVGLTVLGYMLGDVPWIKENLEKVLLGIVFLSVLPMIVEYIKARRENAAA